MSGTVAGLSAATVWAILLYSFTMSVTPGPNNMLLASSGLRFGFRRTLPMVAGVQLGVIVQLLLMAAGLGAVFVAVPWLKLALKVAGSLYLLWLAWHLLVSAALADGSSDRPPRWWQMVAFQFVNPKAWVVSIAFVAGFVPPVAASDPGSLVALAMALLLFGAVGIPSCLVWALFGSGLRGWLQTGRRLVTANRVFALLTAATVVLLWI